MILEIFCPKKSGVKLVKDILKRFIIDVGFIWCLTSIRLTYQCLILPFWFEWLYSSPQKFTFQSTLYPCIHTLLLNYLYLLIIFNYPCFIRCVIIANQLTGFYMSLFYCARYFRTDFNCPRFQFRWLSQTCFIDFLFLTLNWLICIWQQVPNILNYSFLKKGINCFA